MNDDLVIADTGPLVAALTENEPTHQWAIERLDQLRPPLLTCEPVLTEAFFLLRRIKDGHRRLFQFMSSGLLRVEFRLMDEGDALKCLMDRYSDLPMSLADACLVRMAELHPKASVFTLDHHFRIYRKNGRQNIPLIMPEQDHR